MPYNSIEELPEQTRGLSEKKKRQFMHIFNSCYAKNGDEKLCFKEAWSVTGGWKKEKSIDDIFLETAVSETLGMDLELED